MDPDNVFTKGVWLFTSESGAGTYYVFTDENTGHTERDDGTGGIPFACEQDGWDITFHFGGVDDTTLRAKQASRSLMRTAQQLHIR